jgi:hypothetical protein
MRNRAARGCLIAFCFLLENIWRVAQSRVKPHPNTQQAQQQPQADKRGTLDSPFVVKPLPAEKNQQEADEDARDKSEKRWNDRITIFVAIATAVILILQLIVFGLQARRLRQTIEAMKKIGADQSRDMQASIAVAKESADAAKKSADVAAGYSRPMLFVSEIYFQEGQVRVDRLSLRAKIVVEIKNFGETPAFLRRSCVDIAVGVQEGYLDVLTHKTGEAVDKRGSHILKPARVGDLLQDDAALNEVINWRKLCIVTDLSSILTISESCIYVGFANAITPQIMAIRAAGMMKPFGLENFEKAPSPVRAAGRTRAIYGHSLQVALESSLILWRLRHNTGARQRVAARPALPGVARPRPNKQAAGDPRHERETALARKRYLPPRRRDEARSKPGINRSSIMRRR